MRRGIRAGGLTRRNGYPSNPEGWHATVARRIYCVAERRRDEFAGEELRVMTEGLDAAAADAEIDQQLAAVVCCASCTIPAFVLH
jgi:predicted RNA polymerase sigma factor